MPLANRVSEEDNKIAKCLRNKKKGSPVHEAPALPKCLRNIPYIMVGLAWALLIKSPLWISQMRSQSELKWTSFNRFAGFFGFSNDAAD
jgi:hypothetical protein